jgi:ATP-dependent Clp protease ATP-binding subunit ClpC
MPAKPLYDEEGDLDLTLFEADGRAILDDCIEWNRRIDRPMFLPIDLLVVLLRRGHGDLRKAVNRAARGTDRTADEDDDIGEQLEAMARRVERKSDATPRLHSSQLSLGFTGILEDAISWAREAGRTRVRGEDIVRAMRWRAELQESASIRWALKQLGQPGGDHLFQQDGALRLAAFVEELGRAFSVGMELACAAGIPFVGTPQLMAAVCGHRGGLLVRACELANLEPRKLRDELLRIVGTRTPQPPPFALTRRTLTPRLIRMLMAAAERSERHGRPVTEVDLLEAFLTDGGSSLDLVRSLGLEHHIREVLSTGRMQARELAESMSAPERPSLHAESSSGTPTLDTIGRDLSAEARAGHLPEVRGREAELQRVINVLLRTEQRNPLLTGEAGVGKTALAAALARRIHEGRVPQKLRDLRVVELNGASLVGGTSYRGELEMRIKSLLSESEQGVILFIDEAHAVFAPRSSSGQPAEVPNHFKAALASGQIAVVAATTEAEYHRWIEQDPALRRRFERIEVPELSPDLTREILRGLAPGFEQSWEVPVTPEAVEAAVDLSVRFMPEQSLPDKAKKLLMDATIAVASEVALQRGGRRSTGGSDTPLKRVVTRLDVARQVTQKTGIPFERVARASAQWWAGIEERLARHVVGQPEVVRQVARYLVAGRLHAVARQRPQAVFVFAGPPGVGKADLARGLAVEVFGSTKALIRLEMGDFSESHALSRLIGTPPGYVGYQDEDALVAPLRRRPSSVVLLKDFNLAHPRVQERLIRLFAEGEIADMRGLRADASHAIFVLTLDVDVRDRAGIGFGADEREVRSALRTIDAELAGRMKGHAFELVQFKGGSDSAASLLIDLFESRLEKFEHAVREEYGLGLDLDEAELERIRQLVRALRDPRDLEALFGREIVDRLTGRLLDGTPRSQRSANAPDEPELQRVIEPADAD